jgi:hypothetical protein
MSRKALSDELKRFVRASIPSVPFLEAMLLLRNEPASDWDATRLARCLYVSDGAAARLLADLHMLGLTECDDGKPASYRYRPAEEPLRTIVDRLAAAYAANLVEITHLIHSDDAP